MDRKQGIQAAVLLLLCVSLLCLPVLAEGEVAVEDSVVASDGLSETAGALAEASVYVTVVNEKGVLALTREPIAVTDADADGVLTVYDALYCAHELKFEGGAEAGCAVETIADEPLLTKLWGVETEGVFGCYRNDRLCEGLSDPVEAGDRICAFVYADATQRAETYCFFQRDAATVTDGKTLKLTLYTVRADGRAAPLSDAVILVNGQESAFRTDANGEVTLEFQGAGSCIVSAKKEDMLLIPPLCAVTVKEAVIAPGDRSLLLWGALALLSAVLLAILHGKRRRRACD